MKKIDFKKEFRTLYSASPKKVAYLEVPDMKYLSVDGKGPPEENPEFQEAIEALYGTAYTLKFMLKKKPELQPQNYFDFVIPPLEAIWWMDGQEFDVEKKDEWKWAWMIMQADYVTDFLIEKSINELKEKKDSPALDKLQFKTVSGGKAVQMLHVGPYDQVQVTIEKIASELANKGFKCKGKHHEIYLSDPRKVPPEKLKTIVRHFYNEK